MKKQKIILIGGGGHCKACIDVIERTRLYDILGIIDREELQGQQVSGYEIIGSDADLKEYISPEVQFLVTIGQIKSPNARIKIFNLLENEAAKFATVISPTAYISEHAIIGKGTIVMSNVNVSASVKIGDNCILNTACVVEHDVEIGNHTHISTSAVVNGNCVVGAGVFIGSNATISSQVNLCSELVIGAGSVIIKNISISGTYVGNPVSKIN